MENNENAVQQEGVTGQNEGNESTVSQVEAVDAGTPVIEGEVVVAGEEAPAEVQAATEETVPVVEEVQAEAAPESPAVAEVQAEVVETAQVAEETAVAEVAPVEAAVEEAPAEVAPQAEAQAPAAADAEGQS